MTPEVSVLLPYRNAAHTLDEALASVLGQRGVRLEVLMIDDGSTDDGPSRVATWASRHQAVVPLRTDGEGLVFALELGRQAARAPWIARMDADDICAPDRLQLQLEVLRADPHLAAVGSRVQAFPTEAVGEGLARYVAWQNGLLSAADHARQLFVEAPLCHPSVVLRREALDAVGGWKDVAWAEDYDLWLRLDAAGWGLAKHPSVLLQWRHHGGRATFRDSRYALPRFYEAKAPHLARRALAQPLPITIWGAGPTGKRMARALEPHGVWPRRFIDLDPSKLGGIARGVPVVPPWELVLGKEFVVVAVGAMGARDLIREHLDAHGFVEGKDYLCAA